MSEQPGGMAEAEALIPQSERFSYLVLLVISLAAWLFFSFFAAISALAGGLTMILSFRWLKSDARRLAANPDRTGKLVFGLKTFTRLILLGLICFVLIRYRLLNIPAFVIGLATVQLGITVLAATRIKRIITEGKEAE